MCAYPSHILDVNNTRTSPLSKPEEVRLKMDPLVRAKQVYTIYFCFNGIVSILFGSLMTMRGSISLVICRSSYGLNFEEEIFIRRVDRNDPKIRTGLFKNVCMGGCDCVIFFGMLTWNAFRILILRLD